MWENIIGLILTLVVIACMYGLIYTGEKGMEKEYHDRKDKKK